MVATLGSAVNAWIRGDGNDTGVSLLRRCVELRRLHEGELVRLQLAKSGRDDDRTIQHLLLQLYGKCGKLEDACRVFQSINRNGVSYNLMIAAYARNGHLQEARSMFDKMPSPDLVSWNTILAAYAQKGRVNEAYELFQRMPTRDVVSWNTMISAYARKGHWDEAMDLLGRLEQPDPATFVGILNACAALEALKQGRQVHRRVMEVGMGSDSKVAITLVNMYGKCKSPEESRNVFDGMPKQSLVAWNAMASAYAHNGHLLGARGIFDGMPKRDIVSWNLMITAYAQSGNAVEALELFEAMDEQPDDVTFLSALEACSCLGDAAKGRAIHLMIPPGAGVKVGNALITMYGKCGSPANAREVFEGMGRNRNFVSENAMLAAYAQNGHLQEAKDLFETMVSRDVISWNTMVAALAQNGHEREAIELFHAMDCEPSSVTFVCVVDACSSLGALTDGRFFHRMIVDRGHDCDTSVQNALMSMYGKCGRLMEARLVFEGMKNRDVVSWNGMLAAFAQNGQVQDARSVFDAMPERDVVSWNSMIAAYAQNGRSREALALSGIMDMEGMQQQGEITFMSMLNACANLASTCAGIEIHQSMTERSTPSIKLHNAVVNMYGKCGRVEDARRVFDECMAQHDLLSWTCMLGAYAQNGQIQEAKSLFDAMPARDVAAWNAMISGYIRNGCNQDAIRSFCLMELQGIQADEITMASLPEACIRPADPKNASFVRDKITSSGLVHSPYVSTALVNMLGKCGDSSGAGHIFDRMHAPRGIFAWNTIMEAYRQNGHLERAVEAFQNMLCEGESPDGTTFLVILSACSHAGLLQDGWRYFTAMASEFGGNVVPREWHYACMIDLLARTGRLRDAEELMGNMPYYPDSQTWLSFLGGCGIHGQSREAAARAAREASKIDPANSAPYILTANLFERQRFGV